MYETPPYPETKAPPRIYGLKIDGFGEDEKIAASPHNRFWGEKAYFQK